MRITAILVFTFFFSNAIRAQPFSTNTKIFLKKSIIPAALISTGLVIRSNSRSLGDRAIKQARDITFPNFHTKADDYLQYAPFAAMISLRLAGLKAKDDWKNAAWISIKSELVMIVIVESLKRATRVIRPDGSARNSFPSGHTAQTFVAATVFHHEFGPRSIWYSVGGYACATAIGVMRILNNRHWASDVLAGAGIGILATEFVYATHRGTLLKKSTTMIIPSYTPLSGAQIYIVHRFK